MSRDPVRAGEVDDDAPSAGGSSAAARSFDEAQKMTSAPLAAASAFVTSAGSEPFRQARVERGRGLPGLRVGAERDRPRARDGRARRSSVSWPV